MTRKLYIKIDSDGMFVEHPHFEDNVRALYPTHNFNDGPPDGWKEFIRNEPPVLGPYQKYDETKGGNIALAFPHNGLEYKLVDDKYVDYWHVLDMTDEERLAKQNKVKQDWADTFNYSSWTFSEDLCEYVAPVAKPDDGKEYGPANWDEDNQSWITY